MTDLPAVIALGVVVGLQAALLALGLVLVYRANRFINFAQVQMGAIASAVLARLVFHGWGYWAALPVALVVGGLTGAAVERLLSWRLFDASRLALLVASIGVAQLLLLAVIAGPLKVDPSRIATEGYPEPFSFRWTLGSAVLTSSQVLTVLVAPVIAVALLAFLGRTKTGKAIRGAASNPDAARLAGISVRRISLSVWVIAGVVSSLAAILFAPAQPTLAFGDSGPGLLLRGLAAALIARMTDFRVAVAAAIVLGIIEQATVFYTNAPGLANLAVAASLAIALVWRARALEADVRGDEGLVIERSRPALPARVESMAVVRNIGAVGWVALFGLLLLAPLFRGLQTQERAVFLVFMVAFAMVGLSITVLAGWAGQVSLGQFAFLGVGAYAAAIADRHNVGIPAMLLIAGAVTAAAAALVGVVAVRYRGLFLGVVTLAFAFAAQSWLFRQSWVTGDASDIMRIEHAHLFGVEIRTVRGVYVIAVVVLALTVVALRSVRRTSVGRAIVAVRDNPALASSYGTSPAAARVMGLAIAGFVTGVAGGLWGMAQQTWSFASFEPSMSFVLLSAAIVGGIGTLHGPILGTIAVFAWPYLVPNANTLPIRAFSSGALLLAVLLFLPGGLAGTLERIRQRLASLLADTAPPPFGPDDDALPLETRDVRLSFGGISAVDGVSITVGAGEIVGLIGANGAGKSTLLSCVSGHLRPDSGLVLIAGQDVTDLAPEFRAYLGVGRTFQDARLFPGLTVIETVMAALDRTEPGGAVGAMANAPWLRASERRKRARALEVLSDLRLADDADTLTSELSTGMRRICDIAAIVATSPSLVILDEPTAGLAQREVEAFAPLLRSIRDTHACSLLIVEHDMPLMMELCDRIYCLEQGRLIANGEPAAIQSDERVIASYLGTGTASVRRSGTRTKVRS